MRTLYVQINYEWKQTAGSSTVVDTFPALPWSLFRLHFVRRRRTISFSINIILFLMLLTIGAHMLQHTNRRKSADVIGKAKLLLALSERRKERKRQKCGTRCEAANGVVIGSAEKSLEWRIK